MQTVTRSYEPVPAGQVLNPSPIAFREAVYNHPVYSETFTSRNYLPQKRFQAACLEMIVGIDVAGAHTVDRSTFRGETAK